MALSGRTPAHSQHTLYTCAFAVRPLGIFSCKSECIKLLVPPHVGLNLAITLAMHDQFLHFCCCGFSAMWLYSMWYTACGMSSDGHLLAMKHCLF